MMKTIVSATAAALLFTALPVKAEPVNGTKTTVSSEDVSAASRDKRKWRAARYERRYYGPQYGYRAPYRSYAADPSFDPYGRPYRPTVNSGCTIDLGYGRFASCDR